MDRSRQLKRGKRISLLFAFSLKACSGTECGRTYLVGLATISQRARDGELTRGVCSSGKLIGEAVRQKRATVEFTGKLHFKMADFAEREANDGGRLAR